MVTMLVVILHLVTYHFPKRPAPCYDQYETCIAPVYLYSTCIYLYV